MTVAFCLFDLPQLATGIIPLAATIPAGLLGWIPLLGQMFAGWVIGGSNLFQTLASWVLSILGYSTMALWLMMSGVSLFGGRSPAGRIVTLGAMFLVSLIPILNIFLFFDLSVWVFKMSYDARREDKEKAEEAKVGYNRKNFMRVQRHVIAKTS